MRKNAALMKRARQVDPIPDDAFKGFADSPEAQEILTAIFEAPRVPGDDPNSVRIGSPRRRRHVATIARRTVAIGVAAAVVAGIAIIAAPDGPSVETEPDWNAELVSLAEQSPRLLLSGEEWRVTRADEVSAEMGEVIFENGKDCTLLPLKEGCYWVSLHWRPAETHSQYLKDRRIGADASSKTTIDGHQAAVFEVDNPLVKTYYAMWLDGGHSLELRSDVVPTLALFNAIAARLQPVDVNRWLSAMPASVVKPDERDEVIDRVLADIPVPGNVDIEELRNDQTVREGIHLQFEVAMTVVCGWVQQWIDGSNARDDAAMREAVNALAGAHDWHVMKTYGGLSYVMDVADAMANNTEVNGNTSVPTSVGYQRHLGCPEG